MQGARAIIGRFQPDLRRRDRKLSWGASKHQREKATWLHMKVAWTGVTPSLTSPARGDCRPTKTVASSRCLRCDHNPFRNAEQHSLVNFLCARIL